MLLLLSYYLEVVSQKTVTGFDVDIETINFVVCSINSDTTLCTQCAEETFR